MKQITKQIILVWALVISSLTANLFWTSSTLALIPNGANTNVPAPETPTPETPEGTTITTPEMNPTTPENSQEETVTIPGGTSKFIPQEENKFTPGDTTVSADAAAAATTNPCRDAAMGLSWIICSAVNTTSNLVDSLYGAISDLLIIRPLSFDKSSTIYQIWAKVRDATNILFVIFILIVIYSQLTSFGLNNYGIKRVLPRIIISVILVNLSFIICALALDISNVIGSSITTTLQQVQDSVVLTPDQTAWQGYDWQDFAGWLTGGVAISGLAVTFAGGAQTLLWIVALALIGAVISVFIGLITISLRHGVISLLVMVSPLAFVAYLLPNTEKWFEKWKDLFFQMLFFYPMFSFLFAACKIAGWSIIYSSGGGAFEVFLGLAIKILPLILGVSLLKMSGTALGKVSMALEKAASPLRATVDGFGQSVINQSRSRYLASNRIYNGSRLRNYLAYRQNLRELDTTANSDIYKNRALERAIGTQTSAGLTTANGHSTWRSRPNRYTRAAKMSRYQADRLATAQQRLSNTLSEYGEIFDGRAAHRLGTAHGETFKDMMKQQFWAENIAQSDQGYLLNSYINAAKGKSTGSREYNRLIADAAGGMGHIGEATIMGQVIKRSVEIEARRRSEASVMINKYNVSKPHFRGMVFDTAWIDDDGFELDENGDKIEDAHYRLKKGKVHREWPDYIAVHKDKHTEITKEQYLALSDEARKQYRKVRYMTIKDDDNQSVQYVYDDDAGYMKEMLTRDIAIGDPINIRYASTFGLKRTENDRTSLTRNLQEETGSNRKYHSTVFQALLNARYAEHDVAFTAMLLNQINSGYITSHEQLNIARLESIWKSGKTNKLIQSDPIILKQYVDMLNTDDETFAQYFPDEAIALYRNVNGLALHGLREVVQKDAAGNILRDENGNAITLWEKINRFSKDLTVEDQRNYLRHEIIPQTIKKIIGSLDRNISQTALDNLKPEGAKHLDDFISNAQAIADKNYANPIHYADHDDINIFDNVDPGQLKHHIGAIKTGYGIATGSGGNGGNGGPSGGQGQPAGGAHGGSSRSDYRNQDSDSDDQAQSFDASAVRAAIIQELAQIFDPSRTNLDAVCDSVMQMFRNTDILSNYVNEAMAIVENYKHLGYADSTTSATDQIAHPEREARARIAQLHYEITDFIFTRIPEFTS